MNKQYYISEAKRAANIQINELKKIKKIFNKSFIKAVDLILNCKGKIIFAGNGGSFADAQHLSAEFICKLHKDRNPLPAIALGTNSSSATAIGNDYGFENIFSS